MAIDPSIYFQGMPANPGAQHYANQYLVGQGQNLHNQQQQMANQQAQESMTRQKQIQSLAQKYQTQEGFDQRGFANEYAGIDPLGAQQLQHKLNQDTYTTQKIRSEAQEAYLKMDEAQRKRATFHAQETVKALDAINAAPPEQREQLWDLAAQNLDPSLVGRYQQVLPQLPIIRAGAESWADIASRGEVKGTEVTEGGLMWNRDATGKLTPQMLPDGKQAKAEPRAPAVSVNMGQKEQFKDSTTLRKEYNDEIKGFRTVKDAFKRVEVASKNDTAASDISLIYAYMKMLDPGSVVREGEFATAQNAASIPDRIRAAYNKTLSGERLAKTTKQDFVNQAQNIYEQSLAQQKTTASRYEGIAKRYSLNPEDVITSEDGGGGVQAPSKGQVQDGFVFLGGDPSKPENWKKVK